MEQLSKETYITPVSRAEKRIEMEELLQAQIALLKKQNDNLSTIKHVLQFYFVLTMLGLVMGGCTVLLGI